MNTMSSPVSTPPERRRRSFFADLIGGFADLTAPLWRGWWDKRYYRSLVAQSSVAAFSFLVVFVAVGWFLRVPIFRDALEQSYNTGREKTVEIIRSVYIEKGRLHTPNNERIVIAARNQSGDASCIIAPKDDVTDADLQSAKYIAQSDRLKVRQTNGAFVESTYTELLDGKTSWRADDAFLTKLGLMPDQLQQNETLAKKTSEIYTNMVFIDLLMRVAQAAALGIVFWVVFKKKGPTQTYPACIRLAIVAMAPGMLVNFITDRAELTALTYSLQSFFGLNQLPFWLLTLAYAVFAVRAVRSGGKEPAV